MEIFQGVVEDIMDPLKLGRVKVRVFGLHTDDKSLIPTESLPWAQVATPTTSASMSGIGHSPTGLLPGSWVILFFSDPECQYPVVFASFPGIPKTINQSAAYEESRFVASPDAEASIPKEPAPDNPVANGTVEKAVDATFDGARPPSEFTSVSVDCINLIKSEEKFSAKAYWDVNSYSIGYGSKTVNGSPVREGQTITEAQASSELMRYVNQVALPEVKSVVKVPITQSMLDALVSVDYNMGGTKFRRTSILSALNSGQYLQAATNFSSYTADSNGNVLGGLKRRRKNEADLFLKSGYPDATGSIISQEKTNSAIEYGSDGKIKSIDTNKILSTRGFSDPSGMYPLFRDEPDTSRLARHENIEKTIVFKKEIARLRNIPVALTGASWDQSPIPYNAQYPHNHVYGTKGGHIMEFDDTPNSKRINIHHAAGTFTEIDDNGTQVNRIVGDGYEILDRNGYVYVKGAHNVTVDGTHSLRVGGAMNVDVIGNTTITTRGNTSLNVSGNLTTSVNGNYFVKVLGTYSIDALAIVNNTGMSSIVPPAPLPGVSFASDLSPLSVVTRGDERSMEYELPDEGNPEAYNAELLRSGAITKEDLLHTAEEEMVEKVSANKAKITSKDCGDIHSRTEFPPSLAISKYYTIGDMNKGGARKIIAQMGLQPQDIACNLKMLAINVLDIVKSMYPNMIITSGFRRPGDAANSSATSRHYFGEAADIQIPGLTRAQYFEVAKAIQQAIPYDQLILEYSGTNTTWIHVSYKKSGNRKQVFTMHNHKRISNFGELKLIS